jgi:hypothetical protein
MKEDESKISRLQNDMTSSPNCEHNVTMDSRNMISGNAKLICLIQCRILTVLEVHVFGEWKAV